MSESYLDYPPVDSTTFDLIIIGFGFPQSLLSAAASAAGKTVLHSDPNPFYGSLFSTLNPPDFISFLSPPPPPPQPQVSLSSDKYTAVPLSFKPLLTPVDIAPFPSEFDDRLRRFSLDLCGPRVLFYAGEAINLIRKSKLYHGMEFRSLEATLMYDGERGKFSSVPDSRRALFVDKTLKLTEKTVLNKFLNLVQRHCSSTDGGVISEEDLESPFVNFLINQKLSLKSQRIILYAIALADYDQENLEVCKDLMKTKDGIRHLALYQSSMIRLPNVQGAMLYPVHGHGVLSEVFSHRAAVKGATNIMRMPIAALLADKDSGHYKGVKLATGQDIFSQQLLIDPQFEAPQALSSNSLDGLCGSCQESIPRETKKVARGICITRKSLKSDASNLLIVYPPRSLYPEQATSVRALQLGSNLAVCPPGMFVLHLSTLCGDSCQGKELLNAAMNALFEESVSGTSDKPEHESVDLSEVTEEKQSELVWTALYIQELTEESVSTISSSPSPDGYLDYNSLIGITEKMFQQMFPGKEFLPEEADPDNTEDSGSSSGEIIEE